jgi:ATP-dependent phosphofructokinase / diphosphate-dependent phosphofructokinase
METVQRLGILTGGGDCPGLNSAIKSVTNKALMSGVKEIVGVRDGWRGLMGSARSYTMMLDDDVVRHIDRQGGTILGTSRTNPFKNQGDVDQLKKCWQELRLDSLVTIGGEDTLGVAARLFKEHQLPIVGIPKTIDRDLAGTEYSLGFESALQVITDSVDSLRSTAESHSRVFVVEIMGRHAGHLALRGGISAGANIILIPEHPFSVARVCELLMNRKKRQIRYSIVFVSEGAKLENGQEILQSKEVDAFGHARLGGISEWLAAEIQKQTGIESRSLNLSHLQRGGHPVAFDRRIGFYFGIAATEAVLACKFGVMAALKNGRVCLVSLQAAAGGLRLVDVKQEYDADFYRASGRVL